MALAAQLLHGSISTAACFEMGVGAFMRAVLVAGLRLMERQFRTLVFCSRFVVNLDGGLAPLLL